MASGAETRKLLLDGSVYDCRPDETVLEALLRQGVAVAYSCRQQICKTCMMRSLGDPPPAASQIDLQDSLRGRNFFLACACCPEQDMEITFTAETVGEHATATVTEMNQFCPFIIEFGLACAAPFPYRGGQFLTLIDERGAGHRFPIASPTSGKLKGKIEIHVERVKGRAFSEWLHGDLKIGDIVTLCGATGELTYDIGDPRRTLVLAGWNGGLGALIGIMQDAFENNHTGEIYLFHGVSDRDHLYLFEEMREIDQQFQNFHYLPCIEDRATSVADADGCARGTVAAHVRRLLPSLSGARLFLCGSRNEVSALQRQSYLSGAAMKDIRTDLSVAEDFQLLPRGTHDDGRKRRRELGTAAGGAGVLEANVRGQAAHDCRAR
jgi:ferredoxin-NADP reductase/ferredoxin